MNETIKYSKAGIIVCILQRKRENTTKYLTRDKSMYIFDLENEPHFRLFIIGGSFSLIRINLMKCTRVSEI